MKFFKDRGPELEAHHKEVGGFVINHWDDESGGGYLVIGQDESADSLGVASRYTDEAWRLAGWVEEDIEAP